MDSFKRKQDKYIKQRSINGYYSQGIHGTVCLRQIFSVFLVLIYNRSRASGVLAPLVYLLVAPGYGHCATQSDGLNGSTPTWLLYVMFLNTE